MTLWPRLTMSLTSTADDADARHADVYLATLLSLRDTCFAHICHGNLPIDICHSDFRLLDICHSDICYWTFAVLTLFIL